MALATKATRGAVAGNGWTTPANASADDNTNYATAAPAKNGNITGDWDFAAFTDGEIPAGATIDSVTIRYQYKVSVNTSIADVTATNLNNGSSCGTGNDATEPLADSNFDITCTSTPTETDLKTAGRIVARLNAHRGSSNTAVTFSLDYIELRVTYHANTTVTPAAGSIALTGYAPAVTATANVKVTPGAASITLTGYAPTVTVSNNVRVVPDAASITLTGYVPSVTVGVGAVVVTPPAGSITLTSYAPTVSVSNNIVIVPAAATIALSSSAPTVRTPRVVTPPAAAPITLTGYAPTVLAGVTVTPPAASISLTSYAPTVTATAAVLIRPAAASIALSTFAPTVTVTAHQKIAPAAGEVRLVSYRPTVSVSGGAAEHADAHSHGCKVGHAGVESNPDCCLEVGR